MPVPACGVESARVAIVPRLPYEAGNRPSFVPVVGYALLVCGLPPQGRLVLDGESHSGVKLLLIWPVVFPSP